MKKIYILLAALSAMTAIPTQAAVTIEGDETGHDYATISAAVNAAETGATILVDADLTETASIAPGAKNITVKGAEGKDITVSFGGINLINTTVITSTLTVENLTFKYTPTGATGRNPINIGRGSLYMKDVTIKDANIKTGTDSQGNPVDRYVISLDNSNGNIPNVVLDNVKILDSKVTNPQNAFVLVRNQNLTLSGDTNLSIYLKGNVNIKSAADFTGHADLFLDDSFPVGGKVVNDCTDASLFSINRTDKCLLANGGNLVLSEIPVVLNRTKSTGFATLAAAVQAATSGDVLVLNDDITMTESQRLNGKTITIQGATGSEQLIRGENFHKADASDRTNEVFFLTNNANDDLTLSNLILNGNNVEITTAALLPVNGCKITLSSVTVKDCSTTWERGLIDNPGSNPGTWHLDGVRFENCTVPSGKTLVTAYQPGNSISGDNSFTLRMQGNVTVDATGAANTVPVGVVFSDTPGLNQQKTAITGCNDPGQFFVRNAGCEFVANGDNLDVRRINTTSITDIEAENDTEARWYDLQGMPATTDAPGLYIKVQNGKATKVLVR